MINVSSPRLINPAVNFAGKGKITYLDKENNKIADGQDVVRIKIENGNGEIPDYIGRKGIDVIMRGGKTKEIIGDNVYLAGDSKVEKVKAKDIYTRHSAAITKDALSKTAQMFDNTEIKNLKTKYLTVMGKAQITGNAIIHHAEIYENSKLKKIAANILKMWDSSEITDIAKVKQIKMFDNSKASKVRMKDLSRFKDYRTDKTQKEHPVNVQEWKIGERQ